ncbi:MAG: ATP-binding protein [bacterium]
MKKDVADPSVAASANAGQDLRQRAEAAFRENAAVALRSRMALTPETPEATRAMWHELEVHQIELEMQNEDLRRAQQALGAERERYFDLYNLAPVGYCTVSETGQILGANLTFAVLFGGTRGALIKQPFARFILKEDADIFYKLSRQLRETGELQACELWMVKSDGARFWAHLTATAAKEPGGVAAFRIALSDITKRKRLEELLVVQADILTHLAAHIPVPETAENIVATLKRATGFDAVGLRLFRGDDYPFIAAMGYTDEFLKAENALAARYPDGGLCRNADGSVALECTCGLVLGGSLDPANPLFTPGGSAWTNNARALQAVKSGQKDHRLHPRDRCLHVGFVSVALIPLRAGDNNIGLLHLADRRKDCFTPELIRFLEGVCVSMGLALQRRQAEEEQARLQRQLIHAQKLESVGRLAGGVAHDFNNLLMGTLGYIDLCRDGLPADHPVRCYLNEIAGISQRSADLTRQLLAFARKQNSVPQVLDLNAVVSNMLKLLRHLIGANIQIAWQPGANLPAVKLDPSQVDQILTNLCVNARDAIDGVGTITIETATATLDQAYCAGHVDAAPGEHILLTVSDTGCGMTKEVVANIFEPFYTTKDVGKGVGLGLTTVYGIVRQNKGAIDVTSEPGKGTTFKIYLPQAATECVAPVAVGTTEGIMPAAVGVAEAPREHAGTILIVEDERAIRTVCSLFLKACGYKVLLAESPAEALDLVARHAGDIHLLITDMIMPGMNGRELAGRLLASKPGLKILYMSGYTVEVPSNDGTLFDEQHFIQKPFKRDDLARKVCEVLAAPGRPG